MAKQKRRRFDVIENPDPNEGRAPFALRRHEDGQIIEVGHRASELSALAFDRFGDEIEVAHDGRVLTAEHYR
jgi:hypothetical protein